MSIHRKKPETIHFKRVFIIRNALKQVLQFAIIYNYLFCSCDSDVRHEFLLMAKKSTYIMLQLEKSIILFQAYPYYSYPFG